MKKKNQYVTIENEAEVVIDGDEYNLITGVKIIGVDNLKQIEKCANEHANSEV